MKRQRALRHRSKVRNDVLTAAENGRLFLGYRSVGGAEHRLREGRVGAVVIWNAQKSLTELKDLGKRMEEFRGEHSNAERLMFRMLKIRDKQGRLVPMATN